MNCVGFFHRAEFYAEGLHVNKDILETDEFTLDDRLQENTYQSYHAILVHFVVVVVTALIHAVLEEDLDELLRQFHLG
jgi:hypothetical protein